MRHISVAGVVSLSASVLIATQVDRFFSVVLLPTYLFGLLLLMMTVEMFTAYKSSGPTRRRHSKYNWEKVVGKKVIRIALIFACVILDATGYLVSRVLPTHWSVVQNGYPLTTLSSIIWFIGIEGWKIAVNFGKSEGMEELPPAFRLVINWIKRVDLFRGKIAGDERWYDHLDEMTDEQVMRMFDMAKKSKNLEETKE
jgi:phage-related holin